MSIFDGRKARIENVTLPILPLRDIVVFPSSVLPVFAITKSSIAAVDEAMRKERRIFVSLELEAVNDQPDSAVHEIGCIAYVIQQFKLPDGTNRLLIEGERRARADKITLGKEYSLAECSSVEDEIVEGPEVMALLRSCQKSFAAYAEFMKKLPPDVIASVERSNDPDIVANLIGANIVTKAARKQKILETAGISARLEECAIALESEIDLLGIQRKISSRVKGKIEKSQREYFLNEQLKEINKELGKEGEEPEFKELERLIVAKNPPEEVIAKARKELSRLSKLQSLSPEAGVLRTYCEWLADLPWSESSKDNRDIDLASKILDEDHYGLKKAKERILEFIAVRQLKKDMKGPILCFVGPPGTGKTSLGRSVARSLGRSFVRISLGGVRDEAEIRGHRKTYVGALPGKIIQSMKKAGTTNPVFLLDEIDKMSGDFRGDPASALLEVLDPEQNKSFTDHYLELPYDLSGVMFITTANSFHNIPYPLLDRMEVIEIPGYSEYEKAQIAQSFIIPKELEENGLAGSKVQFQKQALHEIIRYYTMESGVRNLEREIAHAIRKVAREAVKKGYAESPEKLKEYARVIGSKALPALLGKRKRDDDAIDANMKPGIAYGLAWTEMGGTLLPVEAAIFEGNGELVLTGNLGDVMKESARTALTYAKSCAKRFGVSDERMKMSVHVHVPQGAIPKDGPSAGITIASVILSALSGKALRPRIAMTGEITLSGRLLPIGGIKEKVLAAHRHGMLFVLMPERNRKDLDEIPSEVLAEVKFLFAENAPEALAQLFPEGSLSQEST